MVSFGEAVQLGNTPDDVAIWATPTLDSSTRVSGTEIQSRRQVGSAACGQSNPWGYGDYAFEAFGETFAIPYLKGPVHVVPDG